MPQFNATENYSDGSVLSKAQLEAAWTSLETFLNNTKLDGDNIQSGAVSASILASNSVTTDKISANSVTLAKLAQEVLDKLVPTGSVSGYAGNTPPAGWFLCDGSTVSRTTYSQLFGAIGTAHGSGDGSTTFHLPDYRGRFLRGRDGAAGRDPDRLTRTAMNSGGNTGDAVGSVQTDGVPNLQGEAQAESGTVGFFRDVNNGTATGPFYRGSNSAGSRVNYEAGAGKALGFNASLVSSAYNNAQEVRPENANLNFIIKY